MYIVLSRARAYPLLIKLVNSVNGVGWQEPLAKQQHSQAISSHLCFEVVTSELVCFFIWKCVIVILRYFGIHNSYFTKNIKRVLKLHFTISQECNELILGPKESYCIDIQATWHNNNCLMRPISILGPHLQGYSLK